MFGAKADTCCGCTEGQGGISTVSIQEWLLPGGGGRPTYLAVAKKGRQPSHPAVILCEALSLKHFPTISNRKYAIWKALSLGADLWQIKQMDGSVIQETYFKPGAQKGLVFQSVKSSAPAEEKNKMESGFWIHLQVCICAYV